MRWKPKPPKPKPEMGATRYKIVFAFVPHKVSDADALRQWRIGLNLCGEEYYVWLEWVIRMEIYWGKWETRGWFTIEAKKVVGL